MNQKTEEKLMDAIGQVDERYILEYMEQQETGAGKQENRKKHSLIPRWKKVPFAAVLALAVTAFLGTVSAAAFVPIFVHYQDMMANESAAVIQNYEEIVEEYGVFIGDTQECGGVRATLNNAVLEDHYLLLSYTFDWSSLEEAQDGFFHAWFLPWFFTVSAGENVIYSSKDTENMHSKIYSDGEEEEDTRMTLLYSIDLGETAGERLLGEELTVRLLYAEDAEGFASTFVPQSCFSDRYWEIDGKYLSGEDAVTLEGLRETALYVVLYMQSSSKYTFVLSDEQGNDYALYPYDDNGEDGYWFVKPDHTDGRLILKVVQDMRRIDAAGQLTDDRFEVVCEIPIELK